MFSFIFLIIGIGLIFYYFALKKASEDTISSLGFLILGIFLSFHGTFKIMFRIDIYKFIPNECKSIIYFILPVLIVISIIIMTLILHDGNNKNLDKPDYLIVLGCWLRDDEITPALKNRLECAIEFNKIHNDIKIIVSGGQSQNNTISEATAMKNYLVSNGINENLIICEDKSKTTYENFLFTKKLLEKQHKKQHYTLTVISNNFHMHRAKFFGKKLGFKCLGYPAKTNALSTFNFYVREFFAVLAVHSLGHR